TLHQTRVHTVSDGPCVWTTTPDYGVAAEEMCCLSRATGASFQLHVKLQAPSWISTDRVRVVRNGIEVATVPIPAAMPARVTRFDADIPLDGTVGDAWYVVIVDGDAPMLPVLTAQPRRIT